MEFQKQLNSAFLKFTHYFITKDTHVIADGDLDGVSSASVLYLAYTLAFDFYPQHITFVSHADYTLSDKYIKEDRPNIILDIGSSQLEFLARFKDTPFLIIDHHQIPCKIIPQNVAVINPYLLKSNFSQTSCSLLTCQFFCQVLNIAKGNINECKNLLTGLASIGALVDEAEFDKYEIANAIFHTQLPSIKFLLEKTGILAVKKYYPEHLLLNFKIRALPYLNAPCKFNKSGLSFAYLLSTNREEHVKLFELLKYYRSYKISLEKFLLENFLKDFNPEKNQKFIVAKIGEKEPHLVGVIGAIAARLAQKYDKPAIAFCFYRGKLKGSARVTKDSNLDLLEIFENLKKAIPELDFGGHKNAVGLKLPEDRFDTFYKRLS